MKRMIRLAVLLGCLAPSIGLAQTAPDRPDFTFKRIKPPAAGTQRRITIQIEPPATPTPVPAAPAAVAPARPAGNMQTWFWDVISPALEPPVDGKFTEAAQLVAQAPTGSGISAPSLQTLQTIAGAHGADILRHSVGTKVSPALVLAVIAVESAGRSSVTSSAGAEGLMQLIPDTAKRFGVTDSMDAGENIRGGVAYLDWLLGEFFNDPMLALAGYNAGENAVKDYGGVPPYAETRAYVPKVLAAWNVARLMCLTPPDLPSDGCVFGAPKAN